MPGEFIEEVTIYRCGTNPDGSAIFCTRFGWAKVPFFLTESEDSSSVGWQEYGVTDTIHIPLKRLIATMKKFGITVSYDEEELARLIGPQPIDPA